MARDFELQSRDEEILASIIDGTEYTADPESRIEYLLIELKEAIEGGSGDYATAISLSLNTQTYVMTAQLLNKNGEAIGEAQTIDLPLESTVISGSYNAQTKSLILTLVSGQTITIPIGDIISGLQAEITAQNPLDADLVSDTTSAHKFVTAADKTTWNGKQDALTFDAAPTENSTNPVTSGGVYTAIAAIQQTIGNINTVLEEVL